MATTKQTVASGSGLLSSGAVGFSNVMNVEGGIPENYKPEIVFRNSRGKLVDAYGRKVSELGTNQEAGIAGSEAQKATTSFAPTVEDMQEDGDEAGTTDETENDD